ncbi:Uncharacterised protein [Yersinia enterocolitica]|nr:Uncharacterised protein [Yersinia enterocolitica]
MCEIQKTIEIVFCVEFGVEFGVDFVRKKPHKREGYLGGWPFLFYGCDGLFWSQLQMKSAICSG